MRIRTLLATLLIGAAIATPQRASAQVSVSIGARLGPDVNIYAYSPGVFGDWHTSYRQWTPVTLYYYNGHYYRRSVQGARAVSLYSRNGEYFLPPEDKGWVGRDKRYNYKRAPVEEDRGHAKPHEDNGRGRGRGKP
ncbi:MAG TPA: hypothetical protein VGQ30_11345 [Gemmatimonadaceae bacterium]|jgi:hypothetical protein|nr:hypothetical protein [Gemmatimonadaceae bacterium]